MISFTIVSRFYITSKHNLINVRTIFMKPNWYKKVTNLKFGKMTWPGNIIDVLSLKCYSVRLHNSMLSLKVTIFFINVSNFLRNFDWSWEKFRFSSRYGKNTISTNWICAWNINSRDFSLRTRRTFGSFSLTTRVCLWLDHKPLGLVNIKGKELQTVHFVVWPYCIVDFNPKLASLRQLNKHCKQLKVWKH